jgi:hypothetical protein
LEIASSKGNAEHICEISSRIKEMRIASNDSLQQLNTEVAQVSSSVIQQLDSLKSTQSAYFDSLPQFFDDTKTGIATKI